MKQGRRRQKRDGGDGVKSVAVGDVLAVRTGVNRMVMTGVVEKGDHVPEHLASEHGSVRC